MTSLHMPNEQEEFWAGEFGNAYTERNCADAQVVSNCALFLKAFRNVHWFNKNNQWANGWRPTIIEFGANVGQNLKALDRLGFDHEKMSAVEINDSAVENLSDIKGLAVHHQSIFDEVNWASHDLVISKGLLIHIAPDWLHEAYNVIYTACKPGGYIFIGEYFAPSPTEVLYRGHANKLWRRNYGKDLLQRYGDLSLTDYGFVADIDQHPQDNLNWWILQKRAV